MSNTTERLQGLVEGLYTNTYNNKILWEQGYSKDSVMIDFGHSTVEMDDETGPNFDTDIRVNIYDSGSKLIDTFTDTYFAGLQPVKVEGESYFSIMEELLSMARRQVVGIDKVIDSILSDLGVQPIASK